MTGKVEQMNGKLRASKQVFVLSGEPKYSLNSLIFVVYPQM